MASPRKKRDKVQLLPDEIAYEIKDAYFPTLQVKKTANAWWGDIGKVSKLIEAYKNDATDRQAWVYAGISKDQYDYFVETHPLFYDIRDACKELPNLVAKRNLVNALNAGDKAISQWWAERKMRKEFATRQEFSGPEGGAIVLTKEEQKLFDDIVDENDL